MYIYIYIHPKELSSLWRYPTTQCWVKIIDRSRFLCRFCGQKSTDIDLLRPTCPQKDVEVGKSLAQNLAKMPFSIILLFGVAINLCEPKVQIFSPPSPHPSPSLSTPNRHQRHREHSAVVAHVNVIGQWQVCRSDALLASFRDGAAFVAISIDLSMADRRIGGSEKSPVTSP